MQEHVKVTSDSAAHSAQEQDAFYIAATSSLAERRPRTLKHGHSFAIFDHNGDISPGEGSTEGIFHHDTRHLSGLELRLNGRHPFLLSSIVQDDNALFVSELTNPDCYVDGHLTLARDTIHLSRAKFLWQGTCYERLALHNFDSAPHPVSISLRFQADFADLFQVRGHKPERRGKRSAQILSNDTVELRYDGLDQVTRHTILRFSPAPNRLSENLAAFDLTLAPGQKVVISTTIRCAPPAHPAGAVAAERHPFAAHLHAARRALRHSSARAATITTANELYNEGICRAIADLYMLMTDTPCGPYPDAGIPWFSTAFGRDGIITALEMLWLDPEVARGVLRFLAANQAKEENPAADAEPGKILHEIRSGELANIGEVPFKRYYGSIDSTPLFVMLAGAYFERTADLDTIRELWPQIAAALAWIDLYGDRDGDGFVEYARRTERGLANQGWKDSADSVFHADGSLARGPIALCEVQGYVYAARRAAAAMARALGMAADAARLEIEAEALRARFEDAFWCDEIETYAIALDGDKRPCRVRSSNAGHALFTGIAAPERARKLAEGLMGSAFFSGWGIRTLASTEARYNPMSYHNGSVWPHDNALIALGMARYGLRAPVLRLLKGLFEASIYMDLRRLPELFCGFARRKQHAPTAYPVACSPQAWASAAPLALLQAALGLDFDASRRELCFSTPLLPDFIDWVRLARLQLGAARAEIVLRRYGETVAVEVTRREGDLRVITIS